MEKELRTAVLPWLPGCGFSGKFPHLRRIMQTSIDLLTFHFDKNGGGFVIEWTPGGPHKPSLR
jgi:hypothetical protein